LAPSEAFAGPTLLFEPYTGTVFYAEDPDVPWFPASLTKLMTACVAFEALKAGIVTPDTKLLCQRNAWECISGSSQTYPHPARYARHINLLKKRVGGRLRRRIAP
jgi:D-alanyl-D-alanine carboxypeptidase